MDTPSETRASLYRTYRFALACGALPLVAGVSIFLLWLLTKWDWLMVAGVCVLVGGSVLFLIGVFELAQFSREAFRTPDVPRRRLWISIPGCVALLVLNFPVAGGGIATVNAILTSYTVTVLNNSTEPLNDVEVSGGGIRVTLGIIPPGGQARDRLWFKQDGELELRAKSGGNAVQVTVDGYVTRGLGGQSTVTINPDQTISIQDRREVQTRRVPLSPEPSTRER